jgi:hypothetical protein
MKAKHMPTPTERGICQLQKELLAELAEKGRRAIMQNA